MDDKTKRQRIAISLGPQHDAFVAICKDCGCKPSAMASAIIKDCMGQVFAGQGLNDYKKMCHAHSKSSKHQHILLNDDELESLDNYALIMGQTRHQAIVGIIRSVIANIPQFTIGEIEQLEKSNYELNKIGVNLNHIAHQTNKLSSGYFNDSNVQLLKDLNKKQFERNTYCLKVIKEHTKKVWELIQASRYRTSLTQNKQ